jgi:DNA-binding transcriptional LysR family regulator
MLADTKAKPFGDLRVTTTVGLGSAWLTPRLRDFVELYPDINLQILLFDGELDLSMREADVAIWLREPTQKDLIRRRLFVVNLHVYASIGYLRRHGTPKDPSDLGKHRILTYGGGAPTPIKDLNWLETVSGQAETGKKPHITINSLFGLREAVRSGAGIAVLPDYLAGDDSDLVPVLQNEVVPSFDTYFVYPEELRNSKRINVFRDFLVSKSRQWSF